MDALGKHILIELYQAPPKILDTVNQVEEIIVEAAQRIGATIVNVTFHHFSPYGVSGVVVVEESHLAIHTWPEYGFAAIDIFTCGEIIDPWKSYDFLKDSFQASHGSAMEMRRGQKSLVADTGYRPQRKPKDEEKEQRQVWITQREANTAFSVQQKSNQILYKKSTHQEISIFESKEYGKVLSLDGKLVLTQGDEYAYHEMLVHPAMLRSPEIARVLILGGGDGGALREVLKYPAVKEIFLVEQDSAVVEAVKTHFPELSEGFSDKRVKVVYAEAMDFLLTYQEAPFDVILIDIPVTGEALLTQLTAHLRPESVISVQSSSPKLKADTFRRIYLDVRKRFPETVAPYLAFVPTYPSGMWSFILANAKEINLVREATLTSTNNLKYFTPKLHQAAFALPKFVQDLI